MPTVDQRYWWPWGCKCEQDKRDPSLDRAHRQTMLLRSKQEIPVCMYCDRGSDGVSAEYYRTCEGVTQTEVRVQTRLHEGGSVLGVCDG